jgi:hypothetical protein
VHPVSQSPCRLPWTKQTQILRNMEGMEVIEELDSPCSSLILLLRERNGSFGSVWTASSWTMLRRMTASHHQEQATPWIS